VILSREDQIDAVKLSRTPIPLWFCLQLQFFTLTIEFLSGPTPAHELIRGDRSIIFRREPKVFWSQSVIFQSSYPKSMRQSLSSSVFATTCKEIHCTALKWDFVRKIIMEIVQSFPPKRLFRQIKKAVSVRI